MAETKTKSGAFRKRRVSFAQVSNEALRDINLSLKAKGLYSLIQSYITIENFTLYKSYLESQCKEKQKAFDSAWKELKDNGYLVQYRLQDPEKKTFYYEYELLDVKDKSFADEIHAKQNRKSHTPKKDVMDKACYGEGGVYNNTLLNNIVLNNIYSISNSSLSFLDTLDNVTETTLELFLDSIKQTNINFIEAIINYCINKKTKIKTLDYLLTIIYKNISTGIITEDAFIENLKLIREEQKKNKEKNIKSKIEKDNKKRIAEKEINDMISKYKNIKLEQINIDEEHYHELLDFKTELQKNLKPLDYTLWIKPVKFISDGINLIVTVPNEFTFNKLINNFIKDINNLKNNFNIFGELRFHKSTSLKNDFRAI